MTDRSRLPMRDRILAAALDVIAERGAAAATTKEIARAAGVSEGSLYNHFANKTALIGAAMGELAGDIRTAMADLLGKAGSGPLTENLASVAEAVIAFYRGILPISGPVLGDPDVLGEIRRTMPDVGVGPLRGHQALAGYFAAEREAGRIGSGANPEYLAAVLIGACHQYAFLTLMSDVEQIAASGLPTDAARFAAEVAATVVRAAG